MVTWLYCFGPVTAQDIMEDQHGGGLLASWGLRSKRERDREEGTGIPVYLSRTCPQGPNFLPLGSTSPKVP
jgi:hypothetical protein